MRIVLFIVLFVALTTPPFARAQTATDTGEHWANDRITVLLRRGIASLYPDQTFRPQEPLTRAEFVRWLVIAAGVSLSPVIAPSFADVPAYHPAAAHIEAAVAQGLLPRAPAFLPEAPVTRIDAVTMAVRAIGQAFEATVLAAQPLPFEDTAGLPEVQRGSIAVAQRTEPALLREPDAPMFRPQEPLTRGEAAGLVGGVLQAREDGLVLRAALPVADGAEVLIERRGVLRAPAVWRVQVGAFTTEANAQRLAARMRERGFPVVVELQDGFYKVRVGSFTSALDAQLLKEQLGREGYATWAVQTLSSFEGLAGPVREAALILDPVAGLRLLPAVGDSIRLRRQRTSEIARRTGALAATNGGFFSSAGDPLGCLMIAREVVSEPDPQRSCAGITPEGIILIDRVRGDLQVLAGTVAGRIDGVNRERRTDELILYRPSFDATTRTNAFGAEAAVVNGAVTEVTDLRGNTPIPRDGFVLSGHGRARQWILQSLTPGTPVSVQTAFLPSAGDPRWQQIVHAVGGGPRLLSGGAFAAGGEGFPSTLTDRRHPRTALGILPDGRVLLLVVDGRRPTHSLGMTLVELAMALRALGAVDAMNLDGGGSSTMVVGGRLVNLPSDETGERPVADALIVVPSVPPDAPAPGPPAPPTTPAPPNTPTPPAQGP